MIVDLRQKNKKLRIQVKTIEELNKAITSSREFCQEINNVLNAQARKLKF